jgi:hypothetical protein
MNVGSLFQYKQECYGKYYRTLPRAVFNADFSLMASTHQSSIEEFKLRQNGFIVVEANTGRKKFSLFCTSESLVLHPKVPLIKCNYLKCYISDPYRDGHTIDGWVQEQWVEPFNEIPTYREENMKTLKDVYLELVKNGPKPDKTPQETYRELLARKQK